MSDSYTTDPVPREMLRIPVGDTVLEVEVGLAGWDCASMLERAEGDTELERQRNYLDALVAWIKNRFEIEVTLGQATYIDRYIAQGFEEHKKKLPPLPESATSTESPPANSPSETSQSLGVTLEQFAQVMNSGKEAFEGSSPQTDSETSSTQQPETEPVPN